MSVIPLRIPIEAAAVQPQSDDRLLIDVWRFRDTAIVHRSG